MCSVCSVCVCVCVCVCVSVQCHVLGCWCLCGGRVGGAGDVWAPLAHGAAGFLNLCFALPAPRPRCSASHSPGTACPWLWPSGTPSLQLWAAAPFAAPGTPCMTWCAWTASKGRGTLGHRHQPPPPSSCPVAMCAKMGLTFQNVHNQLQQKHKHNKAGGSAASATVRLTQYAHTRRKPRAGTRCPLAVTLAALRGP